MLIEAKSREYSKRKRERVCVYVFSVRARNRESECVVCVCDCVREREREREREGKVFKEHEKGFFQFSDQFASNLRLGRFKHKQPKTRLTDSKT